MSGESVGLRWEIGEKAVAGSGAALVGERRIALLIDAENVSLPCVDRAIKEMTGLGQIPVRRAYGNWAAPDLQGWKEKLREAAIRPVQQFGCANGKNASDIALVIDAMELLLTGRIDSFCIVSSDSDFTPLVMRLREDGCDVYGVGKPGAIPAYTAAFTAFFKVEGVKPAAKAAPTKKSPVTAPKSAVAKNNQPNLKPETLLKLVSALEAKAAKSGWAELGAACNHARQDLGVDPKAYGRKHMRTLYNASSRFKIVKSGDGKSYVTDMENEKRAAKPV